MSKEKFTPGPWFADRIPTRCDDYPYDSFGVFDNDGKVIMDATNSEVASIEREGPDEEGHVDRWDEQARWNAHLQAAAPELYEALDKLMKRYMDLVSSGDCGFWDPAKEPETIAAGDALAKARGENHA